MEIIKSPLREYKLVTHPLERTTHTVYSVFVGGRKIFGVLDRHDAAYCDMRHSLEIEQMERAKQYRKGFRIRRTT